MRYRLDDLGWAGFEALTQALMKAKLGLGVECWGGRGDYGRDAYALASLEYPTRGRLESGPFVFQAKFVGGANAANAKPLPAVKKAVAAEAKRIAQRVSDGDWVIPRHYILLTNTPLSGSGRNEISSKLAQVMPDTVVHTQDGKDICACLDELPGLRRSFPEIMGLRDLEELIQESVDKRVVERSRAALAEAKDLVGVFVPTGSYYAALTALRQHSFVVLDGPPEMGKTAIARIASLAQLLIDEWQVVECKTSDDFFAAYKRGARQVFVADDAFGRTEFDVIRGRSWEGDLPKIMRLLDKRHWLVWTTRKHILTRALREIDLADAARDFPDPAEVIVSAEDLTVEEKARILYRHAKAAKLDEPLKEIVKGNAEAIVEDDHFTPERIRRFVAEALPELRDLIAAEELSEERVSEEIAEAIRNPTARMRKAFAKLQDSHKWILFALLEYDSAARPDRLKLVYERHRGAVSAGEFDTALDDLTGTFVRREAILPSLTDRDHVNWIHPSYRDLVIDEIADDFAVQKDFIQNLSLNGIGLALSDAGGNTGSRRLPLVRSPDSWAAIGVRCTDIATKDSDWHVGRLLRILASVVGMDEIEDVDKERAQGLLSSVCAAVCERWNAEEEEIDSAALTAYARAARVLKSNVPFPDISSTWESVTEELSSAMDRGYLWESDSLRVTAFLVAADFVHEFGLNPSRSGNSEDVFRQLVDELFELIEIELLNGMDDSDPETFESEAERLGTLASALIGFEHPPASESRSPCDLGARLEDLADDYRSGLSVWEDDDDGFRGGGRETEAGFDIAAHFSDL